MLQINHGRTADMIAAYGHENGESVVINTVGPVTYSNFAIYMNRHFSTRFSMPAGSLGITTFPRINHAWRLIYLPKLDRAGPTAHHNSILLVSESNLIKYHMSTHITYARHLQRVNYNIPQSTLPGTEDH